MTRSKQFPKNIQPSNRREIFNGGCAGPIVGRIFAALFNRQIKTAIAGTFDRSIIIIHCGKNIPPILGLPLRHSHQSSSPRANKQKCVKIKTDYFVHNGNGQCYLADDETKFQSEKNLPALRRARPRHGD